ncbi:MAG: flippase-like domain-containing protein [Anaerolineales bacterium]|nr:flippase-like domain-containing protein [Anaerolineales bacterium]MCZ2288729.1 flippase-like domain-containing protein [Anaerolineales bacterium]
MKKIPRWLPGALISLALIAVILYFVDLREMANAVRKANYGLLAVSLSLSIVWMALRAKAWQTLLRDRPSFIDTFFTEGEGYLLNAFLPFRLGELGRAFLISRKSDVQFSEALPTIVIERVVDLGITAAILLASLPFVVGAQGSERIGYIVGGAVVLGLALMYLLARNNRWALDLFHKLSARWPSLQRFGGGFLESFFDGLGVLTDGWLFLRFLFWMLLDWAVAVAAYYLILRAYFPDAQFIWTFFALGAVAFGGAIPALPGGVGTADGAITAALTLLTGNESTALAVALTVRLYNYVNSGLIGGIGLAREGETLGGVYRELMALKR